MFGGAARQAAESCSRKKRLSRMIDLAIASITRCDKNSFYSNSLTAQQ
jgi:hypothetical protein